MSVGGELRDPLYHFGQALYQFTNDLGCRLDLMHQAGRLARHHTALCYVAIDHCLPEPSDTELLDFFGLGSVGFHGCYLPCQAVAQAPDWVTERPARDDGVSVTGLDNGFFVVLVSNALRCADEPGSYLDSLSPQGKRSGYSSRIRNTAGCNDGDIDCVYDLRN